MQLAVVTSDFDVPKIRMLTPCFSVVAKGDAGEVGDRERSGSRCEIISRSWHTRENFYYSGNLENMQKHRTAKNTDVVL